MIFEHFALNVIKRGYYGGLAYKFLGLKVVKAQKEAPFITFLADASDRVILELYHIPDAPFADFGERHIFTFHLAFVSNKAEADKDRLVAESAVFIEEVKKEDGSHLIML